MLKTTLIALLPLLLFFGNGSGNLLIGHDDKNGPHIDSGILEKMIVAEGSVTMDIDLNQLNGKGAKGARTSELRFDIERNAFFTVIVFNNELRGPLPSTMPLISQSADALPEKLNASRGQLVLENMPIGGPYELTIRDGKTGFTFFNIEGHQYDYKADGRAFDIVKGKVLISDEFAAALGRPAAANTVIGEISVNAKMRAIEVVEIADGEVTKESMPASDNAGTTPGPDVVVGDLNGLAQFGGSSNGFVGLAVGTDSCNYGTVDLNWFQLPNNDHPVIPQNMYRMSGGTNNDERFEQIGQSSVKHAFTALTQNLCNLGCNGVGGQRLGSGCSDPYTASLNAGPNLGSRAWINPFTGAYPRGDSATPPNDHGPHAHAGPSHRILTPITDLAPAQNPGATYYAEAQYVTPHEYTWCQTNPTQCNMYNNVSYRRYNVSGTTSFTFSAAAATVRTKAAVAAWPGATITEIRPAPGVDGIGMVAYKVTQTSANTWHYEYAIYNQSLDRAIQSFSVPVNSGVTLSNVGFHAPPQHPGWTGDGTVGNTGFSSTAWAQAQNTTSMTWSSETLAQNPNANAIRWGTMYNFRFDSNRPPQTAQATIGFLKTGQPITVEVQVPSAGVTSNASVSGRVLTSGGQGVANAQVTLRDAGGNVLRKVVTGTMGNYRFDNVATGATYTIGASAKRYAFTPQTTTVNQTVTDLNFVASPL